MQTRRMSGLLGDKCYIFSMDKLQTQRNLRFLLVLVVRRIYSKRDLGATPVRLLQTLIGTGRSAHRLFYRLSRPLE